MVSLVFSIKILVFETTSDFQSRNQIHHLNWDVKEYSHSLQKVSVSKW